MKTILLSFFILVNLLVYAQPAVEYTYDAAGNRIHRNIIEVGGMAQNNSGETMHGQSVQEQLPVEDEGNILVNLYPNPTHADVDITINYQDVPQQTVTISLHDASGKLLESKQVNDLRHHVSLQNYPVGIYYLRIATLENKTMKEIKVLRK